MIELMNDYLKVGTLLKTLKAEIPFEIWADETNVFFNGYTYQLYDNANIHNLHIKAIDISYNKVKILLDTSHYTYKDYQKVNY